MTDAARVDLAKILADVEIIRSNVGKGHWSPLSTLDLCKYAEALAADVARLKKVEAAALAWCLEMSRYACDIPCRHSDCRLIRALGGTEEHLPAALSGQRGAGEAG